jgi:uncharacterized protein (TIGR02466 family)
MTDFPNKQSIWTSHIYCFKDEKHSSKKDELITHVYDLKNQGKASGIADIAKKNLFESNFDFFNSDLQAVRELKLFCEKSLMHVVKDVNTYDNIYMSQLVPDLRESWAHVTNNNGYHDAHKHLSTSWGGIYYLNVGECGNVVDENGDTRPNGTNRFYSPIQYFTLDPSMQYLRHDVADICPEDGVLVIFPAYLLHSATPYSGKKDRVVISFNSIIIERKDIP